MFQIFWILLFVSQSSKREQQWLKNKIQPLWFGSRNEEREDDSGKLHYKRKEYREILGKHQIKIHKRPPHFQEDSQGHSILLLSTALGTELVVSIHGSLEWHKLTRWDGERSQGENWKTLKKRLMKKRLKD